MIKSILLTLFYMLRVYKAISEDSGHLGGLGPTWRTNEAAAFLMGTAKRYVIFELDSWTHCR